MTDKELHEFLTNDISSADGRDMIAQILTVLSACTGTIHMELNNLRCACILYSKEVAPGVEACDAFVDKIQAVIAEAIEATRTALRDETAIAFICKIRSVVDRWEEFKHEGGSPVQTMLDAIAVSDLSDDEKEKATASINRTAAKYGVGAPGASGINTNKGMPTIVGADLFGKN